MCRSCGLRHNSVVTDTTPEGHGPDGSLDSISSAGAAHGWRNYGSNVSSGGGGGGHHDGGMAFGGGSSGPRGGGPAAADGRIAGLTMKEYDHHLNRLAKENFALKLRVYFLEEKQGQSGHTAPQLYKANIELKVANESLKRQVFDKQQLLTQASSAISQLEEEYKDQLTALVQEHETRVAQLQDNIQQLHKSVEDYASKCQELESNLRGQQQGLLTKGTASPINELTQLCDLAFNTSDAAANDAATDDCWNTSLWNNDVWGSNPTVGVWGNAPTNNIATTTADDVFGVTKPFALSSLDEKTDSQNSRNAEALPQSSTDDGASNPVHVNTTNVTNNNFNNTLPNTSNNLQQMQYQQQQQHPSSQYHHQNSPSSDPFTNPEEQARSSQAYSDAGPQQQEVGGASDGSTALAGVSAANVIPSTDQHVTAAPDMTTVVPTLSIQDALSMKGVSCEDDKVRELEHRIAQLTTRQQDLTHLLMQKDGLTAALNEDLENLKKELQEKECEVLEREEKVEALSQELETRHRQLQTKDNTIHNLHTDLNRVEPEISVKVQEIVERDRIIEEKIEQIEQQNKILVEIQITLDEKQKQIAELEANLAEARERAAQLEQDYNKSCTALNGFISDLSNRDKELANCKKEVKKRDRRIKDLLAELKETLDMLGKAKWEAETGGSGEDSVKEMAEEENERLWAEMEQRNSEVVSLKEELKKANERATQRGAELGECQETLEERNQHQKHLMDQIDKLTTEIKNKEDVLSQNNEQVNNLKMELANVKQELDGMAHKLAAVKTNNVDDNEHCLQLEKLRHKLEVCKAEKAREIDALKGQLELKNNDIIHLQSKLISEAKQGNKDTHNTLDNSVVAVVPLSSATNVVDNNGIDNMKSKTTRVCYEPVQVSITAGILNSAGPVPLSQELIEQKQQQQGLRFEEDCSDAPQPDPDARAARATNEASADQEQRDNYAVHKFQTQLQALSNELKDMKNAIEIQMPDFGTGKKYQDIIRKYRTECNKLRKYVKNSNNSCELLRNRLEELTDFLEQILDMDERGLIDLSKMSGLSRTGLYKSLNDSRALSQTLSQSLLLGMESLVGEELQWDEDQENMTSSVFPEESYYLPETDMTIASSVGNRSFASIDGIDNLNETNHNYANKLFMEVEGKVKRLDDILTQVAVLSVDLGKREREAVAQSNVITALQQQVEQVNEELNSYKAQRSHRLLKPDAIDIACQTLLAMAPRQSVSSLQELSTSCILSCSDTLAQANSTTMEPLIEGEVFKSTKTTDVTDDNPMNDSHMDSSPPCIFRPSRSILTRNGSDVITGIKSSERTAKSPQRCKSASEATSGTQQVPPSPSESETWSEPDRNVSLARIGLETCSLAVSFDKSVSRSRQTRATAALSSESDAEEHQDHPQDTASLLSSSINSNTPLSTALKSIPKRRCDASEVRRLAAKLRTVEHLNEALKTELNIYQSLSHQLSPETDQQQSDAHSAKSMMYGSTTEQSESNSLATSTGRVSLPFFTANKKLRRFTASGEDGLALAAPLLQEIRSLRTKLEESINNNDQLRDQLEAAVFSCNKASDDPSHLTHLTAALLNAQETLQLTREKLAFAEKCEQVQADRCALAERRTEEEVKLCEEIRGQLKDTQQQVATVLMQLECEQIRWNKQTDALRKKYNVAEENLEEAKRMHEESEAMLQNRLLEVTKACEESEEQLKEQHDAINQVYASLQESSHWPHLNHLHSALQASETQVLKVTRDRLVLLGEKSKLQAQLLSAQAQTSLLQDSLCEDEPVPPMLHQQLSQVQAAVRNLQDQCRRLQTINNSITKDKERLQEKLAGYKAVEKLVNKSDITLESVGSDNGQRGRSVESFVTGNAAVTVTESRLNTVAYQQLHRNHTLLQEDYTHLQNLYSLMQDEEKKTCEKLHTTNSALQKAQLSINSLNEQYQDRIQSLQKECGEKLLEAEKHVKDVQQRINVSEEKLCEVQKRCEEKLEAQGKSATEESNRLHLRVSQLQQQLDTETRAVETIKAELKILRQYKPVHQDDTNWSDDKENVNSSSRSRTSYSRSPGRLTEINSALNSSHPMATKNIEGVMGSSLPGQYDNYHRSLAGNYEQQHSVSNSNLASPFVRSPLSRKLHFSDPSLDSSRFSSHYYAAHQQDELDELDELTAGEELMLCGSDSPDLGLGSSDNGQMSSLERVIGHTSSAVRSEASKPLACFKLGRENQDCGYEDKSSGSLRTQRAAAHQIGVIITGRSSLPPVGGSPLTTEQLCAVPGHRVLVSNNRDLNSTVSTLKEQLHVTDARLQEALQQLKAANTRKQTVERAICRQLTKTHQVLRRAKGNLQQQQKGTDGAAETAASSSSAAPPPNVTNM